MNNNDNSFLPGDATAADTSTFESHLSHDDDIFQRPAPRPPTQMNHRPGGGDSINYEIAPFGTNDNEQQPAAVSEEHNAASHHRQGSNNENDDMKQDDEDKVRLKQVNNKMERVLGDIKNNVKTVFKELVAMQHEFNEVKKDLLMIQEEEHKESANLDTLEEDVGETMAHVSPWLDAMRKVAGSSAAGGGSYDDNEASNEGD